jgi:acyl-CoA reductase-like NAD-dependent aldehyde dehydrogenase
MADTAQVRSPYDGRVLGEVPVHTAADIDAAVVRAKAAAPIPTHERAEILDRVAGLLADRHEALARSISDESAKPIKTARVEAARAVDTIRFSAAAARSSHGEVVSLDASSAGTGKVGFVRRVPIGVVGAITPFNFPLNLVAHKLGPALAAGCPVVLKPASATPLSGLALVAAFRDAGLPDDWQLVVTCPGSVAQHLVEHDDVAMITFTGSRDVGWSLRASVPRKRVSLELGNASPVVIEPDGDWETAAAKIKVAGYSHAGQSCISTQRVYVHRSIADAFTDRLVAEVEALVVGDPADDATDVSALIDEGETERVKAWVDEAASQGATIRTGGTLDGDVLRPTVLTDVTPVMRVCRDEVFGPVVAVQAYDDYEDALALANRSDYGLQAAVFTNDLAKAMRAGDVLEFGAVLVNEVPTWRADNMPYGGTRDSGNTREGPAYAVEEMTERRLIVLPAP